MPGVHSLQVPSPASSRGLADLWPGLVLTAVIAAAAFALRAIVGWTALSPLILSIIFGMVIGNAVVLPAATAPGLGFSLKRLLRFGIVLLGFQVTAGQIFSLGATTLVAVVATLVLTFVAIRIVGRALRIDAALVDLIAAGTSICGASAVIATNTVVKARQEHVAYAIACVTVFGTLSMFLYPLVGTALHMAPQSYGIWTGASIHEVAQVVAAAFQGGDEAGRYGTIAKLARVLMLAPVVIGLAWSMARATPADSRTAIPMPWFVFGFIAAMVVNSLIAIPQSLLSDTATTTNFLLSMALAAMGLQTRIGSLRQEGWKPLALGAFGWLFIATVGYVLVCVWPG